MFGPAQPSGVQLRGTGIRMADLAYRLTDIVGRPVVDKTGFTGRFDLNVKFAGDDSVHGIPESGRTIETSDPGGSASIFSALQSQLGLKLQSGKGLVRVLVIDSIARPSGN